MDCFINGGITIAVKGNNKYQEINYIYPIVNVICKKRVEITREQSGTKQVKNPHELYWLFSLGTSFQINSPILKSDVRKFTVKLTSLQDLFSYNQWSELSNRYNKVYHI